MPEVIKSEPNSCGSMPCDACFSKSAPDFFNIWIDSSLYMSSSSENWKLKLHVQGQTMMLLA
jgi:hypothetical protein